MIYLDLPRRSMRSRIVGLLGSKLDGIGGDVSIWIEVAIRKETVSDGSLNGELSNSK